MRYGFTTGSCAAAAAKACAYMLVTGKIKKEISIETPKKISYRTKLFDIKRSQEEVSCAVKKDGGDDPDITNGSLIYAKVSYLKNTTKKSEEKPQIIIDGGIGVGRVTKPGLDQPIGEAAINHIPRQMIKKELLEVLSILDCKKDLKVEIFVPNGEKLAEKTFNPRLGIVGGISILGTSGIVEPMSSQAILDTIRVELKQRRAEGFDYVAVSPGNYGLDFMKESYGYDLDRSIKCSNFIGDTIDMAVELGFKKILLTGHIGKLIKLSGGIMNTHSSNADCRMELLVCAGLEAGLALEDLKKILSCVNTEDAIDILDSLGKKDIAMSYIMDRISYYLNKKAAGRIEIACIIYSNKFGQLAKSKGAIEWFSLLEQEQEQ